MTVFVELFAGSAAVSLSICNTSPPVSYVGSKKGYSDIILQTLLLDKADVDTIVLNDLGLWGDIWPAVLTDVSAVSDKLELFSKLPDPKGFYTSIKTRLTTENITIHEKAALQLCFIAGTYGSKEVGGFKGLHKLRPNVDGFIPSRRNLAVRVRTMLSGLQKVKWECYKTDAGKVPTHLFLNNGTTAPQVGQRVVVYLDPPYLGSESVYKNKISRTDVIELARKWKNSGADVAVSESSPIQELVEEGWTSVDVTHDRTGQFRKNTNSSNEFLTYFLH